MKSGNYTFSQVPSAEIPRSSFDRSHTLKTTFDAGPLIPIFCDEVLPGDTFNLRTSGFARLATPLYPIMDNMYMDTFYFFVPLRLVWDNFQKMMGEQDNPGDSTDFITPGIVAPDSGGWDELSLADYFGLPTKLDSLISTSLPLRAYRLIYNEWFRDQNLQDSLAVSKGDGPDPVDYGLEPSIRGKRHDYFTSCLPFPQKADAVTIPLSSDFANVVPGQDGNPPVSPDSWLLRGGTSTTYDMVQDGSVSANLQMDNLGSFAASNVLPYLQADLTNVTIATINQLREAFQIQKLYERDARGGTRYTEIIRAHFGVTSPDARLQRPEYLGGGSTPINITPIAQTADTASVGGAGTVGQLGAMGTTSFSGHGFNKSFTEHGIIIGLVNVRADLTYQQGINRMWTRTDRTSYYWPALAHLGEQAVLNAEIYVYDPDPAKNTEVFGYQERFAEYRYKPSQITGLFRSNATQSLDAWHLSQNFGSLPVLNDEFISEDPPIDRVIVTEDEPHFIADFHHKLRCVRPMPLYGVPGNIDRF